MSHFVLLSQHIASCNTSRKQFVQINGCRSTQRSLERGAPQGSDLGPLLYLLYTSPVANIINFHKLQYHLYADDTQLYISFKTDCLSLAKRRVECCVNDIDCWMMHINQDKTELDFISSKFQSRPSLEFIQVGDEEIQPKSSTRNLGVTIDQCLDLTDPVKKICVSWVKVKNPIPRQCVSRQSTNALTTI